MRTIIHDLNSKQLKVLNFKDDDKLISAKKCSNHCVGCFSCWIYMYAKISGSEKRAYGK